MRPTTITRFGRSAALATLAALIGACQATSSPAPSPGISAAVATRTPAPVTRALWSALAPMPEPRDRHTATVLADGRVLVVGGRSLTDGPEDVEATTLRSTALYDPASDAWSRGPDLHDARLDHTATRLPDGRVLVGGGYTTKPASNAAIEVSTVEMFDPATNQWSVAGALPKGQGWATATLLKDGRVLVIGEPADGAPEDEAASIFDPVSAAWKPTPRTALLHAEHGSARLADGTVLVVGGTEALAETPNPLADAAVYDPGADSWRDVGPMPITAYLPIVAVLPDGRALIGRSGEEGTLTSATYDPATSAWAIADLISDRPVEAWVALPDGGILALDDFPGAIHRYDPAIGTWSVLGTFKQVSLVPWVVLGDGRVLSAGGYLGCPDVNPCGDGEIANAWLIDPAAGT